jgi:DNA sulfur modification protein DndB
MSIDEKMQREPNFLRIRKEIAPYLASHPDRFFGSLIVLVPKGSITFEPIAGLASLPAAYSAGLEDMGFLTLGVGERIALDGQHRLLALREVITGKGQYGPFQHLVGDDQVCVLVIEFESDKKTRTIFNKVNRHAKPTSPSDNIITSETDGYAIVARRLLDSDLSGPFVAREYQGVPKEIVEWERTSLTKSSTKLVTLASLYETVVEILTTAGYSHFSEQDDPVAPAEVQIAEAYEVAADWWFAILEMPVFKSVLDDPNLIPELRFSATDSSALLLRPVGQVSLVRGLCQAYRRNRGELAIEELVRRASLVNWSPISSNYWRDVIVRADGKMIARKEAYAMAADLLEYLIRPATVDEEALMSLWSRWNLARGKVIAGDIDGLPPEELPQDLPTPVV